MSSLSMLITVLSILRHEMNIFGIWSFKEEWSILRQTVSSKDHFHNWCFHVGDPLFLFLTIMGCKIHTWMKTRHDETMQVFSYLCLNHRQSILLTSKADTPLLRRRFKVLDVRSLLKVRAKSKLGWELGKFCFINFVSRHFVIKGFDICN